MALDRSDADAAVVRRAVARRPGRLHGRVPVPHQLPVAEVPRMSGIVIVDYGMANLRSVQKAFEKVGAPAEISGDPGRVAEADKLVVPGVGAFRDAIARVNETGL